MSACAHCNISRHYENISLHYSSVICIAIDLICTFVRDCFATDCDIYTYCH